MILIVPMEELGIKLSQRKGKGTKVEWSLVIGEDDIGTAITNLCVLVAKLESFKRGFGNG